jgi:catechol 2,3-dioxygenase-like lactoylglutathione lyase family enzyme
MPAALGRDGLSKLLALCLAAIVSTAAQPEEAAKLPTVIRTPLGTNSSQVLLAKFTVSNLAKSYEFYTTVIGLKWALSAGQQQPPAPQPPNASQPAFIEIPLNFSGSLADPFFVIVQRRGYKPTPETASLSWVGFKVPDAPAAARRAKEAGYEVIRDPPSVAPGEMSFGAVRDPDGYSVEFIQAANYPTTGH